MATIGGVTVEVLRGNASGRKIRLDTWVVPGYDSIGAMNVGSSAGEWGYMAVIYGTTSDVETRLGQLQALQGTIVAVVDSFGTTYSGLLVEQVSLPKKQAELLNGGARAELTLKGTVV